MVVFPAALGGLAVGGGGDAGGQVEVKVPEDDLDALLGAGAECVSALEGTRTASPGDRARGSEEWATLRSAG